MANNSFWPAAQAFLDIARMEQVTDERVRCTAVAICDDEGNPTRSFYQGHVRISFANSRPSRASAYPAGGLNFIPAGPLHRADQGNVQEAIWRLLTATGYACDLNW